MRYEPLRSALADAVLDLTTRAPSQLAEQEVTKEVMQAVPRPLAVQPGDEEVALDEPIYEVLAVHRSIDQLPGLDHGITQGRRESFEDRNGHQPLANRHRFPVQHLGHEVVMGVGRVERPNPSDGVVDITVAERRHRQSDPGRPTFRLPLERLDQPFVGGLAEFPPHDRQDLLAREAKILRSHLGELSAAAESADGKGRIMAGGQHEANVIDRVGDEPLDQVVDMVRPDGVVVVQHERRRFGEVAEFGE